MHITLANTRSGPWINTLPSGVHETWLANEQFGGSLSARIRKVTIPPGTSYTLDADGGEWICVLVDGDAELVTADRTQAIIKGAVIHSSTSDRVTVSTGRSTATLLILVETLPSAAHSNTAAEADHSREPQCFSLYDVPDETLHQPEIGFHHMGTRMLLDAGRGAHHKFIFGQSTFAPINGVHVLHRHPGADEMFYVWEGEGAHLAEDGTEYPMNVGDAVFVPRNEWHGFRNTGSRPVRAFFGLIGAGDMARAGNEVFHNKAAPTL